MNTDAEEIFNLLHDGRIISITGSVPGDALLEIKCDYLRERINVPGESFLVKLAGCAQLYFQKWEANTKPLTDFQEIAALEPWITGAQVLENEISVGANPGTLFFSCESASVFTNATLILPVSELDRIAEEYWRNWSISSRARILSRTVAEIFSKKISIDQAIVNLNNWKIDEDPKDPDFERVWQALLEFRDAPSPKLTGQLVQLARELGEKFRLEED